MQSEENDTNNARPEGGHSHGRGHRHHHRHRHHQQSETEASASASVPVPAAPRESSEPREPHEYRERHDYHDHRERREHREHSRPRRPHSYEESVEAEPVVAETASSYSQHRSHRHSRSSSSYGQRTERDAADAADGATHRRASSGYDSKTKYGSGYHKKQATTPSKVGSFFHSFFGRGATPAENTENSSVSLREKVIGFFVAAALIMSVAYFGAAPLPGLTVAFSLAAIAFLCLFLPFGLDGVSQSVLKILKKLVCFPLFWLGLFLLAYMAVQGFNIGWKVIFRSFYFQAVPSRAEEFIAWLPAGVAAPFGDSTEEVKGMNAFRQMMIFAVPWFILCSLWAGVKDRRVFSAVAWAVLVGMLVVVGWGGHMRFVGTPKLFDIYTFGNNDTSFFATFLYQNHAAAWLSLVFGVCVALGLWHWENTRVKDAKSGPHLICGAFALWVIFGIVFTLSFGGVITVALQLFVSLPIAIIWVLIRKGANRNIIYGGTAASVLLGLLAFTFYATADFSKFEGKLAQKFNLAETNKLDNRAPLREATWKMIEYKNKKGKEYIWTGWGAGSYRWISPHFFKRTEGLQGKISAYAHCDLLQMLCEWGIVGCSFVVLAFLWTAAWFLKNIRRWTPATFVMLFSVLLFIAHSWMDFLNYSVPLLSLVAFIVVMAARVMEKEKCRAKVKAGATELNRRYTDSADSADGMGRGGRGTV